MTRKARSFLLPALLLVAALVAAPFAPLVTLVLLSVSMAAFFGILSGRTRTREPRRMAALLVAVCILVVPAQALIDLVRGEVVDWRHELTMFGATLALVAAFLAGRWLAARSGDDEPQGM